MLERRARPPQKQVSVVSASLKVSVVIITHNRADLLKKAIRSVLDQTFSDFELIVVDDCSPDDTSDVVNSIRDDRIRYIRHATNQGEGGSRNTGVSHATGEYLAFLDDDDEWLENKLELQVAALDKSAPNVAAVYTSMFNVCGETEKVMSQTEARHQGRILERLVEEGNFVPPSTVLVRRACLDEMGPFDLGVPGSLDYDMWIRIAQKYQFAAIGTPLVRYRIHVNRLSCNYAMHIRGVTALIDKYRHYFGVRTRANSRRYFLLGIWHCLTGNPSSARRMYAKAISLYPYSPKPYVAIGLTLLGPRRFKQVLQTVVG